MIVIYYCINNSIMRQSSQLGWGRQSIISSQTRLIAFEANRDIWKHLSPNEPRIVAPEHSCCTMKEGLYLKIWSEACLAECEVHMVLPMQWAVPSCCVGVLGMVIFTMFHGWLVCSARILVLLRCRSWVEWNSTTTTRPHGVSTKHNLPQEKRR